ncbi:hypothetical protein NEFER03_1415 [Nematocida sp. LUAm3]|nr:hypothetical protein NEFER03_1415 [Nematocida sp. LUAm3]KAI5174755.1 hypothetical protein NEFER02_0865 [Nematocida sp. LUAm2]KAI5177834.1 hypothetical protein NEFER01_1036 [Nematocida sp. LUAm1]
MDILRDTVKNFSEIEKKALKMAEVNDTKLKEIAFGVEEATRQLQEPILAFVAKEILPYVPFKHKKQIYYILKASMEVDALESLHNYMASINDLLYLEGHRGDIRNIMKSKVDRQAGEVEKRILRMIEEKQRNHQKVVSLREPIIEEIRKTVPESMYNLIMHAYASELLSEIEKCEKYLAKNNFSIIEEKAVKKSLLDIDNLLSSRDYYLPFFRVMRPDLYEAHEKYRKTKYPALCKKLEEKVSSEQKKTYILDGLYNSSVSRIYDILKEEEDIYKKNILLSEKKKDLLIELFDDLSRSTSINGLNGIFEKINKHNEKVIVSKNRENRGSSIDAITLSDTGLDRDQLVISAFQSKITMNTSEKLMQKIYPYIYGDLEVERVEADRYLEVFKKLTDSINLDNENNSLNFSNIETYNYKNAFSYEYQKIKKEIFDAYAPSSLLDSKNDAFQVIRGVLKSFHQVSSLNNVIVDVPKNLKIFSEKQIEAQKLFITINKDMTQEEITQIKNKINNLEQDALEAAKKLALVKHLFIDFPEKYKKAYKPQETKKYMAAASLDFLNRTTRTMVVIQKHSKNSFSYLDSLDKIYSKFFDNTEDLKSFDTSWITELMLPKYILMAELEKHIQKKLGPGIFAGLFSLANAQREMASRMALGTSQVYPDAKNISLSLLNNDDKVCITINPNSALKQNFFQRIFSDKFGKVFPSVVLASAHLVGLMHLLFYVFSCVFGYSSLTGHLSSSINSNALAIIYIIGSFIIINAINSLCLAYLSCVANNRKDRFARKAVFIFLFSALIIFSLSMSYIVHIEKIFAATLGISFIFLYLFGASVYVKRFCFPNSFRSENPYTNRWDIPFYRRWMHSLKKRHSQIPDFLLIIMIVLFGVLLFSCLFFILSLFMGNIAKADEIRNAASTAEKIAVNSA